MTDKLSLEGLNFQATKLNIANNVLTLTLNRPEKKNALNNVFENLSKSDAKLIKKLFSTNIDK